MSNSYLDEIIDIDSESVEDEEGDKQKDLNIQETESYNSQNNDQELKLE
jgi:hypothetical protein